MKICKICGREFNPKHNAQLYCEQDHYSRCPVCNGLVVWNSLQPVRPCCKECSNNQRRMTLSSHYGVDNASKIHSHRASHPYNNLKFMQSLDRQYDDADCIKSNVPTQRDKVYLDTSTSYICFLNDKCARQFLSKYGVNKQAPFKRKGVSVGRVADDVIYEVVRLELCKLKNYDYQLSNFGSILAHSTYSTLFEYVVQLYDLHRIFAQIPIYDNIDKDMQSMNFVYQFTRPARNGNKFIPVRKVYTLEA